MLEAGCSNNSPIILHFGGPPKRKRIPFRFYNFWADFPEFFDTVGRLWETRVEGVPFCRVVKKLKILKGELKTLNTNHGNTLERVSLLRNELYHCQASLGHHPMDESLRIQEGQLLKEFLAACKGEESMLR